MSRYIRKSPSEIHAMDEDALRSYAIREAEKYNRQISRAKKAGLGADLVFVGGDRRINVGRLRKLGAEDLELEIAAMHGRFNIEATKKGLTEYKEAFFNDVTEAMGGSKDINDHVRKYWSRMSEATRVKTVNNYKTLIQRGGSLREAYYEALKKEVRSGRISGWSPDDRAGTYLDYNAHSIGDINKLFEQINRVIDREE